MNDRPAPALDDDADVPALPSAQQIMDDLAASEADEAAGRTDSGADLLAEMDRTAARIRAKIARRHA
jgi:hypothetical protein